MGTVKVTNLNSSHCNIRCYQIFSLVCDHSFQQGKSGHQLVVLVCVVHFKLHLPILVDGKETDLSIQSLFRILPMKYVPPPVSSPVLVREDSILKSIILTDKTYPIKFSRLDEIGMSPTGWVNRMVPPPQLPFEIKRDKSNRFDVTILRRPRKKPLTIIKNIEGDLDELYNCLKWRLGKTEHVIRNCFPRTLVVIGFHKKKIDTLFQALGF